MPDTEVSVSIVTYNSCGVIRDCIRSVIETADGLAIEVLVVDNCSDDGSADIVRSEFPGACVIENNENMGFGRAHNLAFARSRGKYFLILNPDTILFPGALKTMVEFMDRTPDAGVTGPKIFWDEGLRFVFPDLRLHSLATAILHFTSFAEYFPDSTFSRNYRTSAQRVWEASVPVEVEGVTGGMMLVRREAFQLFDEKFFLFFEEHDLMRRIRKNGWKIYYIPDALILHYFEESFRNCTLDIGSIYRKSAEYYYRKHYRQIGVFVLNTCIYLEQRLGRFRDRPVADEILSAAGAGEFLIHWTPVGSAVKYLIELSYNPLFVDRAGTFVHKNTLSLPSSVLKKLPQQTGFLRILPVFSNGATGKIIKVVQIRA